ncbi:MAG: hypothetical protein ACKO2G_03565 [Verrucomicrobiales bacterium]
MIATGEKIRIRATNPLFLVRGMGYEWNMDNPLNHSVNPVATTIALSVGPAAAGAGIGMLIGGTLDSSSRRAAGVTLIGIAILAAAPLLASLVKQRVTGPTSRRGSARTLERIRDGSVGEYGFEEYNFDDLEGEELPPVKG